MLRTAFFRQSAWMTFSTGMGGLLLYAVHIPIVAKLPPGQYSMFATLLQVIHLMMIPSLALQSIYAEAAASARSSEERRNLTASAQAVMLWTLFLCLLLLGLCAIRHNAISSSLKIPGAAPLYLTAGCAISLLWLPMLQGLMQGEENFLWLGWGAIINGAGRFALVVAALYLLAAEITAVMAGVLGGMLINLAVGISQTWRIWWRPWERFDFRSWLKRAVPITLALGAAQTLFCADMVVVQSIFDDLPKIDHYGFAGTIARGLIILTAPLIGVMFPKAARGRLGWQSSGPLRQALFYTALLAGTAALFCALFPQLPILVLRKPSYLPATKLIPWFCWAMTPLAFATVLASHSMAIREFRCVPYLLGVAVVYIITAKALGPYYRSRPSILGFRDVIWTLGFFNLIFLGISVYFNWPWLRNHSGFKKTSELQELT